MTAARETAAAAAPTALAAQDPGGKVAGAGAGAVCIGAPVVPCVGDGDVPALSSDAAGGWAENGWAEPMGDPEDDAEAECCAEAARAGLYG